MDVSKLTKAELLALVAELSAKKAGGRVAAPKDYVRNYTKGKRMGESVEITAKSVRGVISLAEQNHTLNNYKELHKGLPTPAFVNLPKEYHVLHEANVERAIADIDKGVPYTASWFTISKATK